MRLKTKHPAPDGSVALRLGARLGVATLSLCVQVLGAVPGAPGCVNRVGAVAPPSALAIGSFVVVFVLPLVQVLGAVPGAPGCVNRVGAAVALSALALKSSVVAFDYHLIQVLGTEPCAPGRVDRVVTTAPSALAMGSFVGLLFALACKIALFVLLTESGLVVGPEGIHLALGADPTYSRYIPVTVLCLVGPIVLGCLHLICPFQPDESFRVPIAPA